MESKKLPPPKTKARLEILNYIINFSTVNYYGEKNTGYDQFTHNVEMAFKGGFSDFKPTPGTLVAISSAPFSKWYLSWVVKYEDGGLGGKWLLESIEDGQLCWWTNIALRCYPREESDQHPHWRWTDKQFDFFERWKRACKRQGSYITLPVMPKFDENGGVVLRTRTRFGLNDNFSERTFSNWKKVTFKQMTEFFLEAVKNNNNAK